MSTRRSKPYFFDHGTQFFKVQTDEFKAFINPMIENGVVGGWDAHFVEFKDREIIQRLKWDENYPHYVGVLGMNAIAKYLSHDLSITLGTCVQSIHKDNGKWYLEDDQGNARGKYDWVILAIPAQQASELIPTSIPFYSKISTVKMRGCFSLMLGFEQALPLKFDAALVHGEDISWISVNSSKPARNEPFCLLVHSTNQWADEHIDDNWDQVMEYLCSQTSQIIGHDVSKADHKALHAWRYANIEKQAGESHFIDMYHNIGMCGDWFIEGRVEAAFTSGFELAQNLKRVLS